MIALGIGYKVWLENNGKSFGDGPYDLIKGVEKTGSLNQAAAEMSMSYYKAWSTIHRCEERLGFLLLERKVGGVSGGGSRITPEGYKFIRKYESFRLELDNMMHHLYNKHFAQ